MLDLIVANLLAWLLNWFGRSPAPLEPLQPLTWNDTAIFQLPQGELDPKMEKVLQDYLKNLEQQGIDLQQQGIWLESPWIKPAGNQESVAIPAASLTKIATTLAALGKLGADYQFATKVYITGEIQQGILNGDLIIEGSGDPFFVWEEAIALGNILNSLGIRQIKGNLLVTDKFYMNYNSKPSQAAKLLQQALDYRSWNREITQQYLTLPKNTPQPQVIIEGKTQVIAQIPAEAIYQFTRQSLPLVEILRQMNIYSNNYIAQMLADFVGGAEEVAAYTAKISQVNPKEVQLINGSGLGAENRLSPRAVCKMLIEMDRLLQAHNLEVRDLFPVAGRDTLGTIQDRQLPLGTTIKTGTLDRVSALAGAIDTEDRGRVWFAIVNNGTQVDYFRLQQDRLLQNLVQNWQLVSQNLTISDRPTWYLGDPKRNQ
ncbi:MAG: D-alanyl-D-alanine carboxypeptidase [Pleurocapsa sp.]